MVIDGMFGKVMQTISAVTPSITGSMVMEK